MTIDQALALTRLAQALNGISALSYAALCFTMLGLREGWWGKLQY